MATVVERLTKMMDELENAGSTSQGCPRVTATSLIRALESIRSQVEKESASDV